MNFIMTKLSSAKKSIESALSESFGWRNKNNPVYFKFPANYNLYEEIRKTNVINEYTFEDCELFLDAYYIVSDLGKGGFGNVKLAYNKVEERWVALKIMNKKSDKPVRTAFLAERETRLMSLLSHQNLCKFYRAIETDECYIIEMEYVNGCTLQSLIKKKQIIPEKEASGIFAQLVEGMNYLHAHNIIHRDLKPDNIMIDENGMIKIIDLGFATTYEYDQHVKSFCGTGFYKSPEMVRKSKYVGPEVDVWSMGVVLFCMTHGTRPFKGANGNELNFNILRGEFEMNDMLSADLKDLLSKMIKTDVRKRINTKDIGSHRWIGNFQFDEYPLMPITNVDNFVRVHLMHFGFDEEFILNRMRDQRSVIPRFYNLVASIEESKRFDHSFPMSVEQFSFEISAISESKTNSINFVRSNIGRIPFDIQKQSTKEISGLICADEFTIYNKLISYVERCDYVFVCKDGYMQILVSSKVSVLLRIYIKKASEKTCKIAIKFMCGADVLFWDVVTDMLKKKFCHKE